MGVAAKQEMLTPQAPDLAFFWGFTLLYGLDFFNRFCLCPFNFMLLGYRILEFVLSWIIYMIIKGTLGQCESYSIWLHFQILLTYGQPFSCNRTIYDWYNHSRIFGSILRDVWFWTIFDDFSINYAVIIRTFEI